MNILELMKQELIEPLKDEEIQEIYKKVQKDTRLMPFFDEKVVDANSLKRAFDFVLSGFNYMVLQLKEIEDIASINAMIESNDSEEEKERIEKEQFSEACEKLKICGNKVQQITGMIYEYLATNIVVSPRKIGSLIPEVAIENINNNTDDAKTAVRRYKGLMDIEILCQVYDLCVDSFNSAMNVWNKQSGNNLQANNSNLVSFYRGKKDKLS